MATDSLCLENIDEFVHDENKIVTCKWLSLTLKIHVNEAKRLLYTFLQEQRKKDKDVNATYFVAGLSKGDKGHVEHKCLVVAEEDLDSTRSRLSSVTSCHVYSIQRANLKDSNSLYMTDFEGIRENLADCNKYSSIHCQRATVPRSQPTRKTKSPDKPLTAHNGDKASKGDGQNQTNGSGADKSDSTVPKGGKGKKAEPKGSIASMFAQSNKNKVADAAKKTEPAAKEAAKESKPATKKGGVMDFFANAKPAAKPKATEVEKEKPVAKETKSTEKKGKTVPEPKGKKSRPKEDSDSEDQPEKKRRRRIKNDLFDSSSDDEVMEIEEESPIPSPVKEPTPEPESPVPAKKSPEKQRTEKTSRPLKEKPTNGSSTQRRRRRKLVPKTYLDEDGFMVTEKVWESESTDASEVEEEAKKKAAPQKKPEPAPSKKASPQKKSSPVKGKQTSLMSFFKKK